MFTSYTTFTFPLLMGDGKGELRGECSERTPIVFFFWA